MKTETTHTNAIEMYLSEISSKVKSKTDTVKNANIFNVLFSDFNRFGIISLTILIVGCLGGAAVGVGALANLNQLILLVVPTMLTLALILAVAPMKQIFYVSVAACIIDISVILYNVL